MTRIWTGPALLAALAGALGGVSAAGPAAAQQDPDTAIRLNLSPPGARSLGLGSAFLGLADDATAAYTNPAGLTNLTVGGSEVALEVRHSRFRNSFLDRGHFPGQQLALIGIDTIEGLERADASSSATGLSFLSFGWVLPRGWTLAFYRHELARFETGFETQGFLAGQGLFSIRFTPRRSRTELEIVNYGISGAFELELPTWKGLESSLSLGLGLSYYELDLQALNLSFLVDYDLLDPTDFGEQFGPASYLGGNVLDEGEQIGDDDAVGLNLGWLWKLGRERRWSVGGVYRQGAEFDTRFNYRPGPLVSALLGDPVFGQPGLFTVPDFVGLGAAYRFRDGKTRIALDVSRTRYSQRLVDFLLSSQRLADNLGAAAELLAELPLDEELRGYLEAFVDPDAFNAYLAGFRIRDSDEIHLGLERVILVVESLFVGTARVGVWNEPFHELEFVGEDEVTRTLLARPQGDELHYSLGLGLVIKEDYQIDFALDLSDVTNTFSLSLVKFL